MILYLTHGNGEESIPLELPAASSQVEEIDIRLDDICSGEGNIRISDVKSSVKGLWQFIRSADLLDPEDLEKLNRLSRQIDAMSEKERQIFAGALLSECINNLDDVLQTVGRIGQYEIITEVTCDRELGWYLVENGKIDCPEHLKPYLDYVGIGAEFYSNCGGAYTLDGYVVQKEHLPRYSQAPEPWRDESRDEMLRMTLRVDGKPDYTLVLPADEEYLDAVKAYLDIDVFADAMLCDIRFKVPYIEDLIRDTDCPAVEDYNDFAEALEGIWQKPDEEVIRELSALKGIGVWTAEMILLFCMQRPDVFSYDDLAIQRGLRMVYHHRKIDRKLFEKYRRRFSPYCSVASLYLWAAAGGAVPGLKDYAPKKKAPAKKAAPAGSHTEKTSKVQQKG